MSVPTLREALRQWVRYLGILDDAVEVGLVVSGPRGALRVLTESEAPAHTEMLIDESVLDAPLPSADANLEEILVPLAAAQRGRASPQLLLTDQVRRALRAALTSDDAQVRGT